MKMSSFGDVIHTLPALTDLKRALPGIEIDWVLEEAFAPVAAAHPAVTETIPVAVRSARWPPSRWVTFMIGRTRIRRHFRSRRYDFVLDAQGLLKSAILARQAGRPVYGFDARSAREHAASILYRKSFAVPQGLHAVERTRLLFAAAFGYASPAGEGDFGLWDAARAAPTRATPAPAWANVATPPRPSAGAYEPLSLPARYGILIQAASWPSKLWPEDHWQTLLDRLGAEGQSVVIPWGNEAERARANRLAAGRPLVAVLPRRLSGAPLIALLQRAAFAIGLDSGLMHLATALGVPGIWLFGPTDPALTGPYGPGQHVLRSPHGEAPCYRRSCSREPDGLCCMRRIEVAAVARALSEAAEAAARR
ncbi:MAG: lipopolysaccharide heptosyltransferase I [Bauldia sp.]|nr:lipopolysaccharide heptosyltransferase I [Bauldia sp.]